MVQKSGDHQLRGGTLSHYLEGSVLIPGGWLPLGFLVGTINVGITSVFSSNKTVDEVHGPRPLSTGSHRADEFRKANAILVI